MSLVGIQNNTVEPDSRNKMLEQSAATGLAPVMDQVFDTCSNISSTTSLDGREERGHNRLPFSLQYPLEERLGVGQGDHAVLTKNKVGEEL